jgi:hypothetical protein
MFVELISRKKMLNTLSDLVHDLRYSIFYPRDQDIQDVGRMNNNYWHWAIT